MQEIIEIKRKEFTVLEKLGERSYKVERKGEIYFLKKFENDVKGFELFEKNQLVLRNSGIKIPKVYLWDKKSRISVVEFVEGPTAFDILIKEDLPEKYFESLFMDFYYSKQAKIYIDFDPRNFILSNDKLIYWPFRYSMYDSKINFLDTDYHLWMFTKKFVSFAHSLGIDVDESRLENDYVINKKLTLMGIKYYR